MDLGRIGAKRAKLAAELEKLDAAEQIEKDRRAAVAGHALLAEAESDLQFASRLKEVLDRRLTKKRDRVLFDLPAASAKKPSKQEGTGDIVGNG